MTTGTISIEIFNELLENYERVIAQLEKTGKEADEYFNKYISADFTCMKQAAKIAELEAQIKALKKKLEKV